MKRVIEKLKSSRHVSAFTGAGVSTLCGLPDFRGPQGLYRLPDADRIFDINWFYQDPSIYYRNSQELIYSLRNISPGPVHHALFLLEKAGILKSIITQNIDMLHQKAGSTQVFEVHGSPWIHRCVSCDREKSFAEICTMLETQEVPLCSRCKRPYKPDVTFFGEQLPQAAFEGATRAAMECDLMLVLGSSLTVQPAARLPSLTTKNGGELVIINAQSTPLDDHASLLYQDLATFAAAVTEAFS